MPNIKETIYQYQPLWGNWMIDELIGSGGFGTVYRISHKEYGHTYTSAVKIISIPNEDQIKNAVSKIGNRASTLRKYFHETVHSLVNEVNIMYSLSGNSNILGYHDHKIIEHKDKLGWDILIRMEYVKPLSQYLEEKQLKREEVVKLGIDICTALEICAKKGIIHRDIKEENIFISNDGVFKLGDFGIAMKLSKISSSPSTMGTPHYMAPEVFHGESYTAAVDLYSLGIVMFKLLNHGRLPHMPAYPLILQPEDGKEAVKKRMSGTPFMKPDQADYALAKIILKACAFRAKDRYETPQKMKDELEKALGSLSAVKRNECVTLLNTGKMEIVMHSRQDTSDADVPDQVKKARRNEI